jgi:hypothetical protein
MNMLFNTRKLIWQDNFYVEIQDEEEPLDDDDSNEEEEYEDEQENDVEN